VSDNSASWTRRSVSIVALCFVINMVDGMDVNIMSYIRAALSRDWGVADDTMGYVMSAGTFGMGIGALLIAPFADRLGRKPVILVALALMSAGMLATGLVGSVNALMVARLVVGMGIGTVLATMAALAAETAPEGRKDLAVALVQAGFPLAAVATGFVVAAAQPVIGWQGLLLWAAVLTVAMLPAAWAILPKQLPLGSGTEPVGPGRVARLFSADFRARTLLLYSIYAGAFYNFGAFLGTACMGLLTLRVRPTVLVPVLLSCAAVALLIFGNVKMSVAGALAMAFVIGLTLQGGYNGMWPIAAGTYPEANRATGIGVAMGVGRGGAVVGPIFAGYLLAAQVPLPSILAIYCVPLLLCALCAGLVGRFARS
jgi:AAHS family 4-hydroxybenzoate transporter-like MFS transporter